MKRLASPLSAIVALLSITLSCEDRPAPAGPELPLVLPPPLAAIVDGSHGGGNAHFFFLPPLAARPSAAGVFDPSLLGSLAVEVCEWTGSTCGAQVARFTAAGAGSQRLRIGTGNQEHYLVNWHTDSRSLVAGTVYRISVRVLGSELGHLDLVAVGRAADARDIDASQYGAVVIGQTVPIRFRVEVGAVYIVGAAGGTITAADGAVSLVIAANSLADNTVITIEPVTGEPAGDGVFIVGGAAYDFGPDGLSFSPPAQLTITYDEAQLPSGVEERSLILLHFVNGNWHGVAGSAVNVQANTVTGPITGFSEYAVGTCECVASVEVTPNNATLVVGASKQFTAIPRDASGNTISGLVVEWDVDNASVATISEGGLLTALAPGNVGVMATVEGISRGVPVAVLSVAQVEVSPVSAVIVVGATQQLTATPEDNLGNPLTDAEGNPLDLPVTWTTSDEAVATVDATGLVTGVAFGVATITAFTTEGLSATATILVNAPPAVMITSPADGARFALGQSISFSGTAMDPEDGDLSPTMVWTSDIDGQIGTGMSFSTSSLSERLHTITLTATDIHGATGTATIQIAVINDQQPPSLTPPAALTVGTNTACSYTGPIGAATASDDVSSGSALSITNDAPASFPLGATTVTWTATDGAGNSTSATQVVTVVDDDAPAISAPANLTVGTNSGASYVGPIGTATASDNCSSGVALTITNDAPASFPPGATTVTWTATDAAGNSASAAQVVTVVDDKPPSLTPPAALTVGTNTACSYTGPIGTATASDDISSGSSLIIANDAPASFPLGATTVTWTATDGAGNSTSATQVVTVVDDDAPTISPPAGLTVGTNAGASYVGPIGSATATDNCSSGAALTITNNAPVSFPLGTTTVTWTVTDAAGNSASATQVVTVVDDDPPILTVPVDMTVTALSAAGVIVTYSASASDNVDPSPVVSCTPASGATFPLGTTTVSCTATDAAGNSSTATFTVTVRDTTAPALAAPANITVEATSATGAVVTYAAPTAVDDLDPSPVVSCTPASGATFPLGTTTVTCTATDASGNSSTASFTVTVRDTTAPALAAPANITVEATSPTGAVVTYAAPTASDAADPSPVVSCTPASGTAFPLGSTTVTCTATDAAGNSSTATFTVTVRDTTAPALATPADMTVIASSETGAVVTYAAPSATDAVDPNPVVSCMPPSGATFPLGTTMVTCTATDAAGNASTATFQVTVARNAPPTATISSPANGANFTAGFAIAFSGSAQDPEDGALGGSSLVWTSSIDGQIGSGASFSANALSTGSHTITLTATDSRGATGSATVAISVTASASISVPATLNVSLGGTASLPVQLSQAPASDVTVSLTSSNSGLVDVLTPSVTIQAGKLAANAIVSGVSPGTATITATSPGYGPDQSQVTTTAQLNILQSSPFTVSDGFARSIQIRLESGGAAAAAPQPGGLSITVAANDPGCVAVTPSSTTIAAGAFQASVTLGYGGTASLPCGAVVTASASNVTSDAINVTVQPKPTINAGAGAAVGSGLQLPRVASLGTAAHGGVTVTVQSADPSLLLVSPNATTPGTPSFDIVMDDGSSIFGYSVQGKEGATGTTSVTISSAGFTDGTATFSVVQAAYQIAGLATSTTTFSPDDEFTVQVGLPGATSLSQVQAVRAGATALTVSLSNSTAVVGQFVTSPGPGQTVTGQTATVKIQPSQSQSPSAVSTGGVAFDPLTAGTTTVSASIEELIATAAASRDVSVTGPPINAGGAATVGSGLQLPRVASLGASDHGGATITIESSDPSLLLISPDANTPGSSAIQLSLFNGQTIFGYHVQAKESVTGAASVTIKASGFTDGTATITVVQPALQISGLGTSITSLSPSDAFTVQVGTPATNNVSLAQVQAVRAGGTALTVNLSNSAAAVAQLVTSAGAAQSATVQVQPAQSQSPTNVSTGGVAFDPFDIGSSDVAAMIEGFIATTGATVHVNVSGPSINAGGAASVGTGLQLPRVGSLGASEHGGATVTITSADPNLLLVSPNATTPGSPSIQLSLANGTTIFGYHVQGMEGVTGTAAVTVKAPGFADGMATITVVQPALQISGLSATQTSLGANDDFTVQVGLPAMSNTSLSQIQAVRAGGSALTANLTNSLSTVAQLVTSAGAGQTATVQIQPTQSQSPTAVSGGGIAFDPLGGGNTTVSATITGLIATTGASIQVSVSAPPINAGGAATVGSGLQLARTGSLGASQHGGVTVTITSSDLNLLLVSPNATTPGTGSVQLSLANGATIFGYHVQAKEDVTGTATVTVTAAGFTDGTASITVVQPALQLAGLSASTTTLTPDDEFTVQVGTPGVNNNSLSQVQAVRAGGTTLTASVSTSAAAVAQLVTSGGGAPSATVQIQPTQFQSPTTVAAGGVALEPRGEGTTTVAATIPGLIATDAATRPVTVSVPTIGAGGTATLGSGLQLARTGSLGASDHGGVMVTVESSNPSLLLVSPSATTPGTSSFQLFLADGATILGYHVQGFESVTGTANVIIKAAGFSDGTAAVIVVQPALQITGLATTRTATSANDEFTIQVGIPGTNNISLTQVQAVRAGGSTLTANLSNSAAVAQLVTLAGTGPTATVAIQPTQFQSPTTVAGGGVALDVSASGTTTVAGTITGFISTVNASVTVNVTN